MPKRNGIRAPYKTLLAPSSRRHEADGIARTARRKLAEAERVASIVVTYPESYHPSHGQKVVSPPRRLHEAIRNLKLVELPEASWGRGRAGIFNLTQPEMAGELLDRKMWYIKSSGALTVATGDPGCLV